jgi:WD40 repeat protein
MVVGVKEAYAERIKLLRAAAGQPTYSSIHRNAKQILDPGQRDTRGRTVVAPSLQRIGEWVQGDAVPQSWPQLELVLRVLIEKARAASPRPATEGLYGLEAWRRLWQAARTAPEVDDSVCPYRGLEAFQQEHAANFYGRSGSTEALRLRLAGVYGAGGGLLMVLGPSGVGKSSLLRAGLLPAVREHGLGVPGSSGWPSLVTTPGPDPIRALAQQVPELGGVFAEDGAVGRPPAGDGPAEPGTGPAEAGPPVLDEVGIREAISGYAERHGGAGARLILLVDQFEEVFTLCSSPVRRQRYLEALRAACTPAVAGGTAPALVVVGIRADFYERSFEHPVLSEALQERQFVLGPMNADELQEAVAEPARNVGLRIEPGLVELLLRDAGLRGGAPATDAGVLPLVSHALRATWEKRKRGALTIEGYQVTGGIHGAVEATAEQAWHELDGPGQAAALRLLLTLTRIGLDAGHDTRGHGDKQRLLSQTRDRPAAEEALEVLVGARLVTVDAESARLAHEALLHSWPRLRRMIEEHRADLLLRQQVEEDAAKWRRREASLYRGEVLRRAQVWARKDSLDGPSDLARTFLARSTRARRLIIGAVVVALLAYGAIAVVARNQRDDARFSDVVAEADRLQSLDPSLAAQLDLVAHQMRPSDQEVDGRVLSTQLAPLARSLSGPIGAIYDTAFSPDGRTLATASEGHNVQLWNLADPEHPVALGAPLVAGASWVSAARFSPDGRTLASSNGDGTVHLWNVADPAHPVVLGPPLNGGDSSISLLTFSPDGRTLATANDDKTVRLWDLTDPAHPVLGPALAGHTDVVRSVAFSPDGQLLAAGGDDRTVLLWNMADRAHPALLPSPLVGHSDTVHSVAFSPDGRLLATGSDDKTARLWNVTDPARPTPVGAPLVGHESAIWSVAFSPDGQRLATGSQDGTSRLWNLTDPTDIQPAGQRLASSTGGILAVAFSPDGHTLASGGEDGRTLLWSLPETVLFGHRSRINAVAYSPDGRVLASGSRDETVRLWNVADPALPTPIGAPLGGAEAYVTALAFGPDGRLLAEVSADRALRLWNVADPAHPVQVGPTIERHAQYGNPVAFSPDGKVLATTATDDSAQLWNVADPAHPAPLGTPLPVGQGFISSVAFSPDGHTLAASTANSEGAVRLWDVTDPARAVSLGAPLEPHAGQVQQAVFSPDGRTLAATGEDKSVRLWDVTDRARPTPLPTLTGHTEVVSTAAFSPDSHLLVSGGVDKTARVWDVSDPSDPAASSQPLSGHTGAVRDVAFAPDGRTLATASEDDTVIVWNLDIEASIRRVCNSTQGTLTPEQWHATLPDLPYSPPC